MEKTRRTGKRVREHEGRLTFTKVAVTWLLRIGVVCGMLPFVLSAFGKDPVAEMGIAWVTEIVAVILGYLCKAYFETKAEKKQDLEQFKADQDALHIEDIKDDMDS